MRQDKGTRLSAIRSLLPWIGSHRELMEMRLAVCRYQWVSQVPDLPREPKPWRTLDCNGQCDRCEYQKRCDGYTWEAVYRWMHRAYRLTDVERALAELSGAYPWEYRAVIDEWVEPWTDWQGPGDSEPIEPSSRAQRLKRAERGLRHLEKSHHLRGEIVGWDSCPANPERYLSPKERRKQRNRRILEMWGKEGKTIREIAEALDCSNMTVQAVLKGARLREGCLV